jgi:hypothetical protein
MLRGSALHDLALALYHPQLSPIVGRKSNLSTAVARAGGKGSWWWGDRMAGGLRSATLILSTAPVDRTAGTDTISLSWAIETASF